MPPEKSRQIKKTKDGTARYVPYSKRRQELLNRVKTMVTTESNIIDHFADPSVGDIVEGRNTHLKKPEAHGEQPLLDGKEEFKQLIRTTDDEEPTISEDGKLSMEELKQLEKKTQHTLSLVKAKQREWQNYQKVRGELEQTAEMISSKFQHIMGFHSTDQAGAQDLTDELQASPDPVSGAPANNSSFEAGRDRLE